MLAARTAAVRPQAGSRQPWRRLARATQPPPGWLLRLCKNGQRPPCPTGCMPTRGPSCRRQVCRLWLGTRPGPPRQQQRWRHQRGRSQPGAPPGGVAAGLGGSTAAAAGGLPPGGAAAGLGSRTAAAAGGARRCQQPRGLRSTALEHCSRLSFPRPRRCSPRACPRCPRWRAARPPRRARRPRRRSWTRRRRCAAPQTPTLALRTSRCARHPASARPCTPCFHTAPWPPPGFAWPLLSPQPSCWAAPASAAHAALVDAFRCAWRLPGLVSLGPHAAPPTPPVAGR